MEASLLFAILGCISAFCALFLGARALAESLRRKRAVLASQAESLSLSNLALLRLRNGVGLFEPLARRLIAIPRVRSFVERLVAICARHDWQATPISVLSTMIFLVVGIFLVGFAISGGLVGAVAVALCAIVITAVLIGNADDRHREALREEVPAILEIMAVCFGSGFTLLQTFRQVADEVPGYLGGLFGRSAHVLETGGSAKDALAVLRKGAPSSELAFVVAALDVQHQSGGALRQVLDTASESVKGELGLKRSLRVQTAQAKLSARIVIAMPFVLIALFALISPGFLDPFFSSLAGYALLALALLMQAAGIVLVHRALEVEGIS